MEEVRAEVVVVDGALSLVYWILGDLGSIRIPAVSPGGRADALWSHTCCEAFVARPGDPGYRELNLAPSGQWQSYGFCGYREGGTPLAAAAPRISCRLAADRLVLEAWIPGDWLPSGTDLRLGLAVVLEDLDGGLSYWALRHPSGRPDFHWPDAWIGAIHRPATRTPPPPGR